jgi:di/tricarboxylate transporter
VGAHQLALTLGVAISLLLLCLQECLANGPAWDTLTWFAALIAMAAYLNKFGFIPWFSDRCVAVKQPTAMPALSDRGSIMA